MVCALLLLSALGFPTPSLLLGAVTAMMSSVSLRTGTFNQRAVNLLLLAPVMIVSLTIATFLAPHRILGDLAFLAVMFIAVYLQRIPQLGMSLGFGAFMAFFFAMFLKQPVGVLPHSYLGIVLGVCCTAVLAFVVFRDTPQRNLQRVTTSVRAQVATLIATLVQMLESADTEITGDQLPPRLSRLTARLHDTTLQVEDHADALGLAKPWQRRLVDAELAVDRLVRTTVRVVASEAPQTARRELAADMAGLLRFLRRGASEVNVDEDEVLLRIARYDIRGDASLLPSQPEHQQLMVHRAIRELLLSLLRIRRTSDTPSAPAETPTPEADEDAPDAGEQSSPALLHSTRSAIQATVGGALAIVGGELLSAQRWYWAVIAGFVVFAGTSSRGDLLVKGWRRIWGTLAGILAGTVLATLFAGDHAVNVAVLMVCIFFAFYFVAVSYGLMTFFITIMLGMLYDLLGSFTPDLLLLRLEETAIGVAASVLAAMVVLPAKTGPKALSALNAFLRSLHAELDALMQVLVYRASIELIPSTRELDRNASQVTMAFAPLSHRMSPWRGRRGTAARLETLSTELASAARNLARSADPGSLAGLPAAIRTLHRLISNVEQLIAATDAPPKPAAVVSGPMLAPAVDVRALAAANSAGVPDRIPVLHLRRTVNGLDRMDELVLGLAVPLEVDVRVPDSREHEHDQHPAKRG